MKKVCARNTKAIETFETREKEFTTTEIITKKDSYQLLAEMLRLDRNALSTILAKGWEKEVDESLLLIVDIVMTFYASEQKVLLIQDEVTGKTYTIEKWYNRCNSWDDYKNHPKSIDIIYHNSWNCGDYFEVLELVIEK